MKTILAISIMAILTTGVVAPSLTDAYAQPTKADYSDKLKAKSYGVKTKDKIPFQSSHKIIHDEFGSVKKEQVKTYKKIVAEYSAKQILKNLYKLG
ncbi:hypothetical protein [Nitrosopumilus adriaticus]|uniref:hypothetical protein n=1 Tax=Nitrosopumilus adriaticus TaxID=1580092 RepID=UPI00352E43AE